MREITFARFIVWWDTEGYENEDIRTACEIAWENGYFIAEEKQRKEFTDLRVKLTEAQALILATAKDKAIVSHRAVKKIEELGAKLEAAEKQTDAMKCCGNCRYAIMSNGCYQGCLGKCGSIKHGFGYWQLKGGE